MSGQDFGLRVRTNRIVLILVTFGGFFAGVWLGYSHFGRWGAVFGAPIGAVMCEQSLAHLRNLDVQD